jgi:hypothetical protein
MTDDETDAGEPYIEPSEAAAKLLEGCPQNRIQRFIGLAERVHSGPRPRTAAIRLACVQCTNWDSLEVGKCEIQKCALWEFRMGR